MILMKKSNKIRLRYLKIFHDFRPIRLMPRNQNLFVKPRAYRTGSAILPNPAAGKQRCSMLTRGSLSQQCPPK
jgi:hypothetical protein